MMKIISEEFEVCDVCQKEKVTRYYHGGAATCDWCGKVLCRDCYQIMFNDTVCSECITGKFRTYLMLVKKRETVRDMLEEVEKDIILEMKELQSCKK